MGGTTYNADSRSQRAHSMGYNTVTQDSIGTVFTQKTKREIHPEMDPKSMKGFRECRDSDVHPYTVPIQLYLDVTGSMGEIPIHLIKEGLPKLISSLIQRGVADVSLMFGAIGDHECDHVPLQLGQFESGDEELDMWLTRVYPEGGGGGNGGESYGLAYAVAGQFIETDAWDKRKEKGYVFTIGDEPSLLNYPGSMLKSLFGNNLPQANGNYTLEELYEKASEKNHIFHIHIKHNRYQSNLGNLLEGNLLTVDSHTEIPELIVKTVMAIEGKKLKGTDGKPLDTFVGQEQEPKTYLGDNNGEEIPTQPASVGSTKITL